MSVTIVKSVPSTNFVEFKNIADKKKEITDGDIEAIILSSNREKTGPWSLIDLEIGTKMGEGAIAKLTLNHAERGDLTAEIKADGPVEATFQALSELSAIKLVLTKFDIKSVSEGDDAQLTDIATNILKNEEERKKIYDQIFDERTLVVYKENFKLTEKNVTYEEFVKLASVK